MDVQDCISTIRTHLKRSQQIMGIGIFLVPITHWLGFVFLEAKSGETQRNRDGWTVYLDETSERLSQREVKNKMDKRIFLKHAYIPGQMSDSLPGSFSFCASPSNEI